MLTIPRNSQGCGRGRPWLVMAGLLGLGIWLTAPGWVLFSGCSKSRPHPGNEKLIGIGRHIVTALDFNKALEFAKTAYPHNAMRDTETARMIKTRLLNELTEELLLLTKAEEMNIRVEDNELEAALMEIKKDYPDNTFEETFLENAISYEAWKNQLRKRLLMEKLITLEFEAKIRVTPADIADYYKLKNQGPLERVKDKDDVDEAVVKEIRRFKAENAYKDWMGAIQKQYPVELNQKLWDEILAEKFLDNGKSSDGNEQ